MISKFFLVLASFVLVTSFAIAKEPNKPEAVPANATWVEADNEWELGKRNTAGNMVGEWKWWLAPQGHLVAHTFHEKGYMLMGKHTGRLFQ